METYATEEQQWEAIKQWFKKYGNRISWALIIILSIVLSVQYWTHHQTVLKEQASESYMALLTGVEQHDEATVKSKAQNLMTQYPDSPYASLAALFLTNQSIEAKDYPKAEENLNWIMQHGKPNLQGLARVRLMRLMVSQNKLDEALALYNEDKAPGFLTLLAELKGDILMKKNDVEGAKTFYEKALSLAPEEGMHGPLLKMKLESLGVTVNDNKGVKK